MFQLEPPTLGDAAAVAGLVEGLEAALYGSSTFSEGDVREEWAKLDLSKDLRVVRDGERVVGYGAIRDRAEPWRVEGYVHPDLAGRGIGTLIAGWLETEARQAGARRLLNDVLEADVRGCRLLEGLGYRPVRVFREMRIELTAPPPEPVWPDGLRVVPFEPEQHGRAFHAAQEEAFLDHWAHTIRDFDSWAAYNLGGDRFDPSLWCVVWAGDEIAAGTRCAGDTYGGGFVHTLFTRRPWRRQGVGKALLADAFGRFWARGERSVGLGVDAQNATGAFGLYEGAGMRPALGWLSFEKALG